MIDDADLLQLIIHGNTAFALLQAALEFDLFERLDAADGMDLATVAAELGIEPQPARILLLGLSALRLIRKEGETYTSTAVARRNLIRSRASFLGPLINVQAEVINPAMGDIAASLRSNSNVGLRSLTGPGTTLYQRLEAHPRLRRIYYENMGHASRQTFPLVVDAFDFSGMRHVLDLCCGDGSNTIELARRNPRLEITMLDQGPAVEAAAARVEAAGLSDRVHAHVGDIFSGPLPTDIDCIICCHIFEIWSIKRNIELMRKCRDALPPGGATLVYNFVSNADNTGPLSAAFMSLYFLALASGEGMVYSSADMRDALGEAGFSVVKQFDGVGFSHALVVGYR